MEVYIWLCLAALAAGAVNAVAGGGTLLTFPTLIGVFSKRMAEDVAKVMANGTSTVALVPASLGSAWAFRRELAKLRRFLVWLMPPSLVGGAIGTLLVMYFPKQFGLLVPWLILTAATLFTLQPLLARRKPAIVPPAADDSDEFTHIPARSLAGMIVLQFFIAIYGGYFGAGIGILMLTGLRMMGLSNMHQMNGVKSVLGTAINGVATVIFILYRQVDWRFALAMMATSTVGGYLAAHYSRQIPGKYVRWFVIVMGFTLASYFFWKQYGPSAS